MQCENNSGVCIVLTSRQLTDSSEEVSVWVASFTTTAGSTKGIFLEKPLASGPPMPSADPSNRTGPERRMVK